MVNNKFLIIFLITMVINILNFNTHQYNNIPCFFDYNYCVQSFKLEIKNGSFYYKNFHIHHWIIGILILSVLYLFEESDNKSIIQGIASAILIDGLLFEDRFTFY